MQVKTGAGRGSSSSSAASSPRQPLRGVDELEEVDDLLSGMQVVSAFRDCMCVGVVLLEEVDDLLSGMQVVRALSIRACAAPLTSRPGLCAEGRGLKGGTHPPWLPLWRCDDDAACRPQPRT